MRADVLPRVPLALCLGWLALAGGCHREQSETRQLLGDAVASHQGLQPWLGDLHRSLAGLHQDVEQLAASVPGGAELRAKYFSAQEVVGVLDAKLKWLSDELATAKRDLKREAVVGLRDALAKTAREIRQVSDVILELTHEKARLQRIGALLAAPYEHQLATGYRVKAARDGLESRLIEFIENDHRQVDQATWFDFDRLVFAAGGDLDILASRSQLENVVQILRAHPAVRLKIGGHTDNQGSPAASQQVSVARAQAVRKALVVAGVAPERVAAQGFGSREPVCPANDTEECRTRNRRIAALVVAK